MKIFFVGVFTEGSTNVSQRDSLLKLGHEVMSFLIGLLTIPMKNL